MLNVQLQLINILTTAEPAPTRLAGVSAEWDCFRPEQTSCNRGPSHRQQAVPVPHTRGPLSLEILPEGRCHCHVLCYSKPSFCCVLHKSLGVTWCFCGVGGPPGATGAHPVGAQVRFPQGLTALSRGEHTWLQSVCQVEVNGVGVDTGPILVLAGGSEGRASTVSLTLCGGGLRTRETCRRSPWPTQSHPPPLRQLPGSASPTSARRVNWPSNNLITECTL